jgi:hypothetical protein
MTAPTKTKPGVWPGGVVKLFSPEVTDSANRARECKGCHIPTRGLPYCKQCWCGGMTYRHNRAALAYMRMTQS